MRASSSSSSLTTNSPASSVSGVGVSTRRSSAARRSAVSRRRTATRRASACARFLAGFGRERFGRALAFPADVADFALAGGVEPTLDRQPAGGGTRVARAGKADPAARARQRAVGQHRSDPPMKRPARPLRSRRSAASGDRRAPVTSTVASPAVASDAQRARRDPGADMVSASEAARVAVRPRSRPPRGSAPGRRPAPGARIRPRNRRRRNGDGQRCSARTDHAGLRIGPLKRSGASPSRRNPEFTAHETRGDAKKTTRREDGAKKSEPRRRRRDSLWIAMTKHRAVASISSWLGLLATASCTSTSAQPGNDAARAAQARPAWRRRRRRRRGR